MEIENLPVHVGIIMDGNGRWAKRRGLPRIEGHRVGAQTTERIVIAASNIGIRYLSLFAFSTENWKRPKEEVNFLFHLMYEYVRSKLNLFLENNVRFRAMGRLWELPTYLREGFAWMEEQTAHCTGMTAVFAVNYGGRQELLDAFNRAVAAGERELTEDTLRKYLYLPELPDLDLLIRTSGELRISNFLLWQSAYTELWFTQTLWPDFTEEEFKKALLDYSRRERRFGGLK
ncbi:polyprenyl diphosphate synthase [Thermovibrio ammonificans]|uniref:Isoprenyl transferase n=1 Tax=Thermovibrio ammonificans (strain DSM 15698 / JCM 12110 / HB-1) TaxID=648996 RepID=E8T1Z2_THEA1|nr:polyprenyl diphosphate synthase [Thermovibrio ammonificans]ADU96887.1 undecaprenyl diphosphate synthase [Thermovibrio ammonificans HB-1]